MNVVLKQVQHRQFGNGTVISQSLTTVMVQFCEEYGTKTFLFPSAFESFLELCDPESKAQMDNELSMIRKKKQEERRIREEEEQKRRDEEHRIMLEQKTSRKRTSTKKNVTTKKRSAKVDDKKSKAAE